MRKRSKQAVVLVTVLWVVVILMVIVASLGRTQRVDTKVSLFTAQQRRCAWASYAGVETAIAMLLLDDTTRDSLDELWSDNDADYNEVSIGGAIVTIHVTDECGKLNLNTATRTQLLGLEGMEPDVADAILDWRDKNEEIRNEGAESAYYEQLTYGYRCRNAPFQTVRELLLVKGVDESLFWGEDTNFNNQLDENEQDGEEREPVDNGDGELDRGWVSLLTCYSYDTNLDADGSKRINVKEANRGTLERELNLSASHARWIEENRKNFKSIGDLINNKSPKEASGDQGGGNQAKPLDLETYKGIVDRICIDKKNQIPGRVNINTAPKEVLVALLGGGGDAEQTVGNIISYRSSQAYGFSSIGELLDAGLSVSDFKKMADQITVRSPVYSIRSVARAAQNQISGATAMTEVVVDRTQSPPQILYRYQGAGS